MECSDPLPSLTRNRSDKGQASAHWKYVKFIILPLVWIHSALPWLTKARYGVYTMKPDATWCYLSGGAGVFEHDLHIGVVMTYFLGCGVVIIGSVYKARYGGGDEGRAPSEALSVTPPPPPPPPPPPHQPAY